MIIPVKVHVDVRQPQTQIIHNYSRSMPTTLDIWTQDRDNYLSTMCIVTTWIWLYNQTIPIPIPCPLHVALIPQFLPLNTADDLTLAQPLIHPTDNVLYDKWVPDKFVLP